MRTTKKVKYTARERRKLRLKKTLRGSEERPRICVFKSDKHIYAQIISDVKGVTLAAASTKEQEVISKLAGVAIEGRTAKSTKSVIAAKAVGLVLAERAKQKGLDAVVFDRNGYVYHGRVKAVADGAREGGLNF